MEAEDREARFAEWVERMVSALADIGQSIAKMFEHLYESLGTILSELEDLAEVENGEGEPIYNTISGATQGDIRVSTYTRGGDSGSGRDVKHRETLCVIVNHSETN